MSSEIVIAIIAIAAAAGAAQEVFIVSAEIIIAIIAAVGSILGVVLSNNASAKAMDAKLDKAQAVTEAKLEALTEEVRRHNDFARRVPVLEEKIKNLEART